MATHNIVILNKVAATDIGIYNRSAYCTYELDNGNVFRLETIQSTSGCEVWAATKSTGSAADFWMAYSPDVNSVTIGSNRYRGLTIDQQDFSISACTVFDAIKPQVGDVYTMTADGFSNTRTTETYANSADNSWELAWGSAKSASALSLRLMDVTTISKPTGTLGDTQQVVAYRMVVIANPTAE